MDTRRDFMFIEDLIEVVLRAVDGRGRPGSYPRARTCPSRSSSTPSSRRCRSRWSTGSRFGPATAMTPTILLEPSKTNADFAWRSNTSLDVGVAAAIDWYKRFGIHQIFTHLKLGEEKK